MELLIAPRATAAGNISAMRATLRIMEAKGHLRHAQQDATYFCLPKIAAHVSTVLRSS
jgi:hypothetical protein